MRGLYPIVDLGSLAARSIPALPFAERVLSARPKMLQLRAKDADAREILALLRALGPLCRQAGTELFANDRPDLALLADCDGVHVGQTDLEVSDVRRIAPRLKVGISTHDTTQLERALADRPDYVAFGPIFATSSKQNPDGVVGVAALERAVSLAAARDTPVVAIGGITLERAAAIRDAGAVGAVIAALLPDDADLAQVSERALSMQRALGG